jgi:hypothetical protein
MSRYLKNRNFAVEHVVYTVECSCIIQTPSGLLYTASTNQLIQKTIHPTEYTF